MVLIMVLLTIVGVAAIEGKSMKAVSLGVL